MTPEDRDLHGGKHLLYYTFHFGHITPSMADQDQIVLNVPDKRGAESLIVGIQHSHLTHASRVEINRAILAVASDNPNLVQKEVRGNVLDDAFDL